MQQQETANQIAKELSLLPSEMKASQPLRLPPAGPLNCFSRQQRPQQWQSQTQSW